MIEKTRKSNNEYQFVVKSMDGGILLRSIGYNSENQVDLIVAQMTKNITNNIAIERTTNHKGQFQFCVKHSSNSIIGFSQPYSSEAGMENGINNLTRSISTIKLT